MPSQYSFKFHSFFKVELQYTTVRSVYPPYTVYAMSLTPYTVWMPLASIIVLTFIVPFK